MNQCKNCDHPKVSHAVQQDTDEIQLLNGENETFSTFTWSPCSVVGCECMDFRS